MTESTDSSSDKPALIKEKIASADAVIIGAGAGLSTSAGFTYSGERFDTYFSDFARQYGFSDMYAGGFFPYETLEEHWGYWSRYIYVNRYMDAPKTLYQKLFELVKDKDYFVLTTNVDHCFQKAGFDKQRLFYTQGDYGLFQCSRPCHKITYENEAIIRDMVLSQGFLIENGALVIPEEGIKMRTVPSALVPYCPKCKRMMSMNLRADNTFVEDAGWHEAAGRYEHFIQTHKEKTLLFLELGVGFNTPGIIKYPFWQMTNSFSKATYVCLNQGEAFAPDEIAPRAICLNADIDSVFESLRTA
ncbi:MAG: Sir2 silent information regulator family NAD-dependent deacetylase [Lachnospiraceae bacterium]|nr:Sir2 silent information regulator family NAD-dependent deacetylase [Lachnospiraceae bacterium]